MRELRGPTVAHDEVAAYEGELHHLRCGHSRNVDHAAEVIGMDVHDIMLGEKFGEHRSGNCEERVLGEMACDGTADGGAETAGVGLVGWFFFLRREARTEASAEADQRN